MTAGSHNKRVLLLLLLMLLLLLLLLLLWLLLNFSACLSRGLCLTSFIHSPTLTPSSCGSPLPVSVTP